ncbi:AAA family ATPase [Brevundimonas sp. NPDC092305]|uniref:AAA family ATPase n=1 Tax=Brevundimonas sp. NPDC092305 TaxID=3363957 RepID=UPI0038242DEE
MSDEDSSRFLDFYRGSGVARGEDFPIRSLEVSETLIAAQTRPEGYRLGGSPRGQAIITAVNVALALRTPLLVSGEPGSGKTQLGYAIAWELGRPEPLKFTTKSTSVARDILYEYDAVRHFRASQTGAVVDVRDYINYAPLGLAILLGSPLATRRHFLSPAVFEESHDADLLPVQAELHRLLRAEAPRQAVVIIDEIDKAPRDFPNDLLDELNTLGFRIPELQGLQTPQLEVGLRPIVLVTTNGERALPDAFLRRCAYIHMTYPTGEELDDILMSRLGGVFDEGSIFRRDVRILFERIREADEMQKPPGIAELIQFLQATAALGADPNRSLADQRMIALDAAPLLAKSQGDQAILIDAIASVPPARR